jgi:putative ABC transport system substrate-binding protein
VAARGASAAAGDAIVGFVTGRSPEKSVRLGAAFRKGLNQTGYVDGQNVMVEYRWLEDQYNRLPSLMADLVSRRVAVITTFVNAAARNPLAITRP